MSERTTDNAIVDPDVYADYDAYHAIFAGLRRDDPVHWTQPDGFRPFWTVAKHADIVEVARHPDVFQNGPRTKAIPIEEESKIMTLTGGRTSLQRTMISMNGEEHAQNRGIAREWFLPRHINKLQDQVSEIAARFIDRMDESGGECEFVNTVGVWYPLRVIMLIFGLPPEVEPQLQRLSKEINGSQDPELRRRGLSQGEHLIKVTGEFFEYFKTIAADRRAHPTDDLASVIANARINGELLADHLVQSYYLNIAVAGHDSTSSALTGGIQALAEHPAEIAKLRRNPDLMKQATEEILRWVSPLKHFFRNAVQDFKLNGRKISAGDTLLLAYPSANRDEDVFDDPFAFRVDREQNPHLAFGHGVHGCLGQVLARQEITTFNTQFLQRVDHLELAGEPTYVRTLTFGGLKTLPIRYTAPFGDACLVQAG
jgi:cytochrome P450